MRTLSRLLLTFALSSAALSCATRGLVNTHLQIDENLFYERPENRRVENSEYYLQVENPRRLQLVKLGTGEEKFINLDWPLTQVQICPTCSYSSLWYRSEDGTQYNALMNIAIGERSGDITQNLGPTEYLWSPTGKFMAMGFPTGIEIIETKIIEEYLGAEEASARKETLYRDLTIDESAGKNVNIIGFYDDFCFIFSLGFGENPDYYAIDLDESRAYRLACRGSDCKRPDELGALFEKYKGNPQYYAPTTLINLRP